MYTVTLRYFDRLIVDYDDILEVSHSSYGILTNSNNLPPINYLKGTLNLKSEKSTYIVSCENLQSIEITKD